MRVTFSTATSTVGRTPCTQTLTVHELSVIVIGQHGRLILLLTMFLLIWHFTDDSSVIMRYRPGHVVMLYLQRGVEETLCIMQYITTPSVAIKNLIVYDKNFN